jgi:hypothetical protein
MHVAVVDLRGLSSCKVQCVPAAVMSSAAIWRSDEPAANEALKPGLVHALQNEWRPN